MELKKVGVNVQAYTDDILTLLRGNFRNGVAAPKMHMEMRMVDAWSQKWRLIFNPKKCNAIWFQDPESKFDSSSRYVCR